MSLPTSVQIVVSIDDLLTQILLRLPIKSFLRFTTVSTHWYNLITDPKFCRLRHHLKLNRALGLFLPRDNNHLSPSYNYVPLSVENPSNPPCEWLQIVDVKYGGITILQSCNGLLLCRSHRRCHLDLNYKYYVYNPTINRFVRLPKPPHEETEFSERIWSMQVAFDPAKSPHYKVVCLEGVRLLNGVEIAGYLDVYSSETGLWKVSLKESFYAPFFSLNGVYWNGSLHWICDFDPKILYFVIDEDRLETLPTPVDLEKGRTAYRLWESCDHLNMIAKMPRIEFDVYEMKRDYSEWFVKYHVDLSPLVPDFPGMILSNPTNWDIYALWIFCVIRGDKDEDDFLVLHIPGKAIRYNLVSKTFQELHRWFQADENEASLEFKFREFYAFQYIESLCRV